MSYEELARSPPWAYNVPMPEREELAAAIALHFGMLPERQGIPLKELYKAAAFGAEAFQYVFADEVSWEMRPTSTRRSITMPTGYWNIARRKASFLASSI